MPSPSEHNGAPASPSGRGHVFKAHVAVGDNIHAQSKSKEHAASSEKEAQTRLAASGFVQETPAMNLGAKSVDLKEMLITVLRENPKGMSFKAGF